MGRRAARRARLRGALRGGGWLFFATLFLPATAIVVTATVASADLDLKRVILGTIVAPGTLEVQSAGGGWVPATQGTPVLADSDLRTGAGKRAMIALGREGVIGLSEESRLHIGSAGTDGLPIVLESESELTFRLPATTTITFLTDAAVVKAPQPVASDDRVWIQGTITQKGNETTVTVLEGDLQVRNRETTDFANLRSGQQAIITGSLSTPRIARMTDASEAGSRRRLAAAFGTKTGLAIAGATAVAVGAGLGGVAAAGGFDSAEEEAQGSPGEPPASPFRP